MKTFRIEPVGKEMDVRTATTIVQALLSQGNGRVKQVCGGKGLCATCHVKVRSGVGALSPVTARERSTLSLITGAGSTSRLACQAKVLGDGVIVDLPPGIYLESLADIEALIGRRAEEPLLHPVTGMIVVPAGKIITRSVVMGLKSIDMDVVSMLQRTDQAV